MLIYDLYSVFDNQKALKKNTFQANTFKVKNIQGLFKDLHRNLRTFPGKNGNIQQQQYTTMYFVQVYP